MGFHINRVYCEGREEQAVTAISKTSLSLNKDLASPGGRCPQMFMVLPAIEEKISEIFLEAIEPFCILLIVEL